MTAGKFILTPKAALIREIQARIEQHKHLIIPAYDDASRELAGVVQAAWFKRSPARQHFHAAIFPKGVVDNPASITVVSAHKDYIPPADLTQLFGGKADWHKDVLVPPSFPQWVIDWLESHWRWPQATRWN